MKALLKIIDTHQHEAFQLMQVKEQTFFPAWHFHPECEIMLVKQGTGIRYAGDSMHRFRPGDLVLYGKNLPHLYRSDNANSKKKSGEIAVATVIYFREQFLGQNFLDLPESLPIRKLLSLSQRGIRFKGKRKDILIEQLKNLEEEKDSFGKIILLLNVLHNMSGCSKKDYELLSSPGFSRYEPAEDYERINSVYQYIMDNYSKSPTLEEVAKIACLSETSFCRYFKAHTNKTYTQFLNEIKIGNACKLLIDQQLSLSQVCFETGFNNFNHFNNQFKKIMGLTPGQYKHHYFNEDDKIVK